MMTPDEFATHLENECMTWDTFDDQRAAVLIAERDFAIRSEMEAEVKRLREALEFYAGAHVFPSDGPWGVNSTDFGDVARAALEAKHVED